jgi:hypothetical protein
MVDTLKDYKQKRNQIEDSVVLMKASEIVEPAV